MSLRLLTDLTLCILWYAMASDVWGVTKTFLVFTCFFVVEVMTTETDAYVDNGTIFLTIF